MLSCLDWSLHHICTVNLFHLVKLLDCAQSDMVSRLDDSCYSRLVVCEVRVFALKNLRTHVDVGVEIGLLI